MCHTYVVISENTLQEMLSNSHGFVSEVGAIVCFGRERLIHTQHAVPMPFPCHAVPLRVQILSFQFDLYSAAVFYSHFPCHAHAVLRAKSQAYGTVQHGMCELSSAVERRHVGDLPAFGFFRLPRVVPRRLEGCYQKHTNLRLDDLIPDANGRCVKLWTSSSDVSGYHVDFHEGHGTVGAGQGHDTACVD